MPVLYRALRQMLRAALGLYYVDIQSSGRENVPHAGPLIFAANHPNSIMDTVVLGTQTERTVCYMARSGLFKNPLVAALFDQCGVIPVYRAQDDPTQTGRNEDSFRRAYDTLLGGGCIGIFPEGHNSEERAVNEIKTGTARIALGAEALADYGAGVRIIPVGLNFENRDRFLTSVLVRFGAPIEVSAWADQHREDPRAAARDLTDTLQEEIRQAATHIESDVVLSLTKDIWDIYGRRLIDDMIGQWEGAKSLGDRVMDELRNTPEARADLDDKFWMKQRIADAITHFISSDPELVDDIRKRVRAYKEHLSQVQLHHNFLERKPHTLSLRKESLKFTLYALLFAPVAIWGLIHNLLPYQLTKAAALKAPDEARRAFQGFVAGMALYPFFYAAQALGIWLLSQHSLLLTFLYLLSLPPAGFFYLRYRRQLARYRDRIILRTLVLTDRKLIQRLTLERLEIMAALATLRDRFVEETGSHFEDHMARK